MKIKKLTKIFLVLIIAFAFIANVKADDNADKASDVYTDYPVYEKVYKAIGAISYYHDHAAVFDEQDLGTNTDGTRRTVDDKLKEVWDTAIGSGMFNIASDSSALMNAYALYKQAVKEGTSNAPFVDAIIAIAGTPTKDAAKYSNFQKQLREFSTLASMFKYAKDTLSGQIRTIKNLCNSSATPSDDCGLGAIQRYEELMDKTLNTYSSFCDKLEDSPGIAHYLKSALQLVSYAALALAVILGALDFIKAITSQDDAALTKAFQAFVKRIVAVALIFMTYVIVETVLGLITYVPGTQASQLEVCEQIRLGALKG